MSTKYLPDDQYLLISLNELEMAWRMLAAPNKLTQIEETIAMVRHLNLTVGPEKAIYTLVAASAWLSEDGFGSYDGLSASGSGNGMP